MERKNMNLKISESNVTFPVSKVFKTNIAYDEDI